jgi:hypothetical protein
MDELTLRQEVRRFASETSVRLMTAFGSSGSAVQAIKVGASEYRPKLFRIDELIGVRRGLEERRLRVDDAMHLPGSLGMGTLGQSGLERWPARDPLSLFCPIGFVYAPRALSMKDLATSVPVARQILKATLHKDCRARCAQTNQRRISAMRKRELHHAVGRWRALGRAHRTL